jgi:PTH1 family peptidyl-tRNA hydrolase
MAERDLADCVRIGVGIGRCESRERDDVARYVMRRMIEAEKRAIEGAAGNVLTALWAIAEDGKEERRND